MARIARRVLGLGLLIVAIAVPGCKALFPRDAGHGTPAAVQSSDHQK